MRLILCLFIVMTAVVGRSQDQESKTTLEDSQTQLQETKADSESTENWQSRPTENWSIRTGIQSQKVYIKLPATAEFNNDEVRYDPSTQQSYFVGLEKNEIGASVTVDSLFRHNSNSDYKDFRFYKYGKQWSLEASWMKYQSFNLSKSNLTNPRTSTQERKDISFESYRIGGMYNLYPDRLSLPSILNGAGIQKKSAGTIFLTGALSQTKLGSDLGLIPYQNDAQTCCQYKNDLNIISASVGIMGIYNLVIFEKWLAGAGWGVELGTQTLQQTLGSTRSESFAYNRYLLNFGYQQKDYFALIYFLENSQQIRPSQIGSATLGSLSTQFVLGYYL